MRGCPFDCVWCSKRPGVTVRRKNVGFIRRARFIVNLRDTARDITPSRPEGRGLDTP
jgi:hypothetical protein